MPPTAPAADADDDAALVRRMAAGDADAVGPFYDRWSAAVQAVALAIVRERPEAEDVVEETFWQAWRQAARFDPRRGTVSAWLLTIARSRAMDQARVLVRRRETSVDEAGATPTPAPDPAEHAAASERRSAVADALGVLPEPQREVIEMAYFGGLSQSEIAACTGQPLGTVKTRARLAMQKLRERLAALREVAG
jgi:RNA polymerase sigma-70 factor (ECF subfamily)